MSTVLVQALLLASAAAQAESIFSMRNLRASGAHPVLAQEAEESSVEESSHRRPRIVEGDASQFSSFMRSHQRSYSEGSQEYSMRQAIFQRRAAEVERHNSKSDRLWTAGINTFSDRTDEELSALRGWKRSGATTDAEEVLEVPDISELPSDMNWTNLASIDFIRDQDQCGSCWAVTATTVLAAAAEKASLARYFSTQEVVDCVPNPHHCGGSGGCDGATVELAFQYVMEVGVKEPEEYGAYTASDHSCAWTPNATTTPTLAKLISFSAAAKTHAASAGAHGLSFGMRAWQKLPTNRYAHLLHTLFHVGPVAIALAANDLQMYAYGIFNGCEDWIVNHAVTLVGYGEERSEGGPTKYWLVQNSWGNMWGENGRFRLLRTDDEESQCGLDTDPQAGLACEDETDPVEAAARAASSTTPWCPTLPSVSGERHASRHLSEVA
eukprot:CAMPEP_0117498738 /NCGR_PEP_ID=MMETSP0784-20121206/21871_1 /TAXON_ID=39447 /ORGANISM="" /LENGTH=438 /DNA_ID=CAMNT_0005293837 /DNA_START=89 /DNA_END=1403 /DNA_ORIENTATION=+